MRRLTKSGIVLAVVALCAVAFVACGGDDDDDGDSGDQPTAVATEVAGGDETPASGGSAQEVTITAEDFSFTPSSPAVDAGEVTFTLKNEGSAPHTLTFYSDSGFENKIEGASTDQVSAGSEESFTVTFDESGEAYFRCEVHPSQMQGELTIN